MVDVVCGLKWIFVFIVYFEGIYGEWGIWEFLNGVKVVNICIVGLYKIEGFNNEM